MRPLAYINDYNILSSLGERNETMKNIVARETRSYTYSLNEDMSTPVFECLKNLILSELPKAYQSRNNFVAYLAIKPLIKKVEALKERYSSHRIGIVVGTSTSGIDHFFTQINPQEMKLPKDYNYSLQEMGNLSSFLSHFLDIKGFSYTISTACSSSARAFIEGQELIKNNICDAVIVGGCDSFTPLTIHGFHSLGALSKNISNPFSVNRDGINIGEGAAFFILSKEEADLMLLGCGESSDGHHISSPCPEGSGARIAITGALRSANLRPLDIDYINLHGTGTVKNDQMESLVTNSLFGEEVYCSSTKPLTGHALGAAGAIEAGILCETLLTGSYPAHYYDKNYDNQNPLINLTKVPLKKPSICLSNTYAFGGSNASLIIGKNI